MINRTKLIHTTLLITIGLLVSCSDGDTVSETPIIDPLIKTTGNFFGSQSITLKVGIGFSSAISAPPGTTVHISKPNHILELWSQADGRIYISDRSEVRLTNEDNIDLYRIIARGKITEDGKFLAKGENKFLATSLNFDFVGPPALKIHSGGFEINELVYRGRITNGVALGSIQGRFFHEGGSESYYVDVEGRFEANQRTMQ